MSVRARLLDQVARQLFQGHGVQCLLCQQLLRAALEHCAVGVQDARGALQVVGQQRGVDLAAHYASADLFLFPSLTETFGNVTVEALASGLPVVAFDYAAAGQLVIQDHNGMLAPVGAPATFVAAAVRLAQDDAQRHAMARQARQTAQSQGWEPVIDRFESILRRMVAIQT